VRQKGPSLATLTFQRRLIRALHQYLPQAALGSRLDLPDHAGLGHGSDAPRRCPELRRAVSHLGGGRSQIILAQARHPILPWRHRGWSLPGRDLRGSFQLQWRNLLTWTDPVLLVYSRRAPAPYRIPIRQCEVGLPALVLARV
jgi:hypothetical protein